MVTEVQIGFDFDQEAGGVLVPAYTGHPLRPYQKDADEGIRARLRENKSTLVVMATGTGKTTIFAHLAHNWPSRDYAPELSDRVLVLAHREELLFQARARLASQTGEMVGLEKAEYRSGTERIVVASVQTLYSEARRHQWKPDTFGLVIYDEAHHACSKKNREIVEYFSAAKVVGFTATPDRADEKAMGAVFESDPPACVYEIDDAIADGWLVPVEVHEIFLGELDLSSCSTTAGDLNQGDLDAAMVEAAIAHMVKSTVENSDEMKTLFFTTSVDNASRSAELFQDLRPGSARTVNAKTPMDLRRLILSGFERGDFQYLTNVGIATEGYDCPPVACIAQGRPTKSRSLHAQIVGRGLRPMFPADFDPNTATAEERRAAIARSAKPVCRVLEFTGNSGRHSLACTVDILGGKYDDDEVAEAKKKVREKPGLRAGEALEEARNEIAAKKRNEAARKLLAAAKTNYTKRVFNPFEANAFDVLHIRRSREDESAERFGGSVATDNQLWRLRRDGVAIPKGLTKTAASKLIATVAKRKEMGLCNFGQAAFIEHHGIPSTRLSFTQAAEMIGAIHAAGEQRPPADVCERIIGRERMVGEDG